MHKHSILSVGNKRRLIDSMSDCLPDALCITCEAPADWDHLTTSHAGQ